MTEATVAVAEQPAPEPVPSEWPLAEETLADHPRLHLALGWRRLINWPPDGTEVADLPLAALIADPVIIEDPAAFDASLAQACQEIDAARAEVVTDSGAALMRATENLWPLSAHYRPLQLVPGEEALQQHQMASVTDLGRWAPGRSLSDDPDTDKAATRYFAALATDPEGDEDRAQLPAEVHHETGEPR